MQVNGTTSSKMEQQKGNGTTVIRTTINGTTIKRTKSRESKPTYSHSAITFFSPQANWMEYTLWNNTHS